jgi:hypothetical protein
MAIPELIDDPAAYAAGLSREQAMEAAAELAEVLETYDFQSVGGPLKNSLHWLLFKEILQRHFAVPCQRQAA